MTSPPIKKKSENLSLKSICNMGKLSKAAQAHPNNLSKASLKPCRVTVEDAPESDSESDSEYCPRVDWEGCEQGEEGERRPQNEGQV
jgi:hypothetical protein